MAEDPYRDHLDRKLGSLTDCALYRRTVHLVCASEECGHFRILDAVPLWWLYNRRGWDDRLPGFLRHFYCSRCWRAKRWILRPRYRITGEVPPEKGQFPYPLESEWKRLVRRYRS